MVSTTTRIQSTYSYQLKVRRFSSLPWDLPTLYQRVNHAFGDAMLLEMGEYGQGNTGKVAYIGFRSIADFRVKDDLITQKLPDQAIWQESAKEPQEIIERLDSFTRQFAVDSTDPIAAHVGFLGYMAFDAVRYFDDLPKNEADDELNIPDLWYHFYQYLWVIDHERDEVSLVELTTDTDSDELSRVWRIICHTDLPRLSFQADATASSSCTDESFLEMIRQGQQHCFRGDVFQLVLSRRFYRNYTGNDFALYITLRTINPSPYMFYFNFGEFRLIGASPEAQIVIDDTKASIYPIAGTYRRTHQPQADAQLAHDLLADPKENAEHVMLVDLARNDLSRHGFQVNVERYREVQYYSHVLHLVSKVTALRQHQSSMLPMVADTFPAGTLSGAPKHKAISLIQQYEPVTRSFYGGAIGWIGLNQHFNHAILIRSYLSRNQVLCYQAGAGIVALSKPESELAEVHNKLIVLNCAIERAQQLSL